MKDWQRAMWLADDGEAGDVGIDLGTLSGALPEAGIRRVVVAGAYPALPIARQPRGRCGHGVVHPLAAPSRRCGGADGPSDAAGTMKA